MKKPPIIAIAFLAAVIGLLGFLWFTPSGLKQAPPLNMTTLQGQQISLNALQGRPVVITFWATTCPGCIKEMPHLVELYHELAPKGLEIIGIAMDYDPEEQVRTMVAQKQLPYPITMDTDGSAAQAFGGISLTPSTFLIDTQGRIVQYKLGEVDIHALRNRIVAMLNTKKA